MLGAVLIPQTLCNIEIWFYAILWIIRDYPVVSGGGNRSNRRKLLPNAKSLAKFSLFWLGFQPVQQW